MTFFLGCWFLQATKESFMTGQEKKCTRVEEEKEEGRYGEEEEDHYYHQSKIPKKKLFLFQNSTNRPTLPKKGSVDRKSR